MTDSFLAPTSETSVQLVEVTGFIADMYHSQDALRRVMEIDDGTPTDDVLLRSHFVTAAVVSYWRCYMNTSRPTLDAYVPIADEFAWLHEELRVYRNRTIAHADSGLVGSHILSVDPGSSGTIYVTMPPERVKQMAALVDVTLDSCDALANSLRASLSQQLTEQWMPEPGTPKLLWDPRDPR